MRAFTISGMKLGASSEWSYGVKPKTSLGDPGTYTTGKPIGTQFTSRTLEDRYDPAWNTPDYGYSPASTNGSSGSKTPLIIGGIAAAAVIGIGGYFLLRKKGKR